MGVIFKQVLSGIYYHASDKNPKTFREVENSSRYQVSRPTYLYLNLITRSYESFNKCCTSSVKETFYFLQTTRNRTTK